MTDSPRRPFTDFERDDSAEIGVMWRDFVSAIGIWVYVNEDGHKPTIAEAALVFNTTPDLVREAVSKHRGLFTQYNKNPAQQYIESEGE